MNLADYLTELLGQQDEVNVPGLGCFIRERISGYYNEAEARFYPPYHRIKFDPTVKENDDTFVQYIAEKKNISLASSKYFAEKFIAKLREDAENGTFIFSDLGQFYTDQDQRLVFKPYDKIAADPSFYGFAPINILKIGQPAYAAPAKPVYTAPPVTPQVATPVVAQPVETEAYYEDEPETEKKTNIWLIILIAIAAIVLGLVGVAKFFPSVFDNLSSTYQKITGQEAAALPIYRHEVKTDTAQKQAKTPVITPPVDTVKWRFEIITGSYKTLAQARAAARKLTSKGVKAVVSTDVPGQDLRVSVGSFTTLAEAEAKRAEMTNDGKIKKDSEIVKINPQL